MVHPKGVIWVYSLRLDPLQASAVHHPKELRHLEPYALQVVGNDQKSF
ncbi:Branched-chain amino acid transport ATP-binding protein [Streptococcus parauberis KRS-02109]|nr:Branched-chain amino acid transport ATP-binding protein [Streptococcus parauberis KRS-02109]